MKQSQEPQIENLQIELTNSCNERCVHCYLPNKVKDSNQSLEPKEVVNLLHQFYEMGGKKVVFSGGEVLLYKGLLDILDECNSLQLRTLLQSNLLTMTPELADKFKKLNIFNVQVSLYSTDEQIHDSITKRKGSWSRTKQNLELLVSRGVHVLISCPIMKQNLSTAKSLREYAEKLGVDLYFDYVMMAQCDGSIENLDYRLNIEEMRQMIRQMIDTRPEYVEAIRNSKSLEEALSKKFARRRMACSILSSGLCIDCDGTAYPCPGWNGMELGNIKRTSLAEIWYDSPKTLELRQVKSNDFQQCEHCQLQNFCDMCAVYNYNETGDMFNICKSFCDCARIMKESVMESYLTANTQI
jgi:radical SAM protein with 4Fe4S-binding SPASM domain